MSVCIHHSRRDFSWKGCFREGLDTPGGAQGMAGGGTWDSMTLGDFSNLNNPEIPETWCVPMELFLKLLPKSDFFLFH